MCEPFHSIVQFPDKFDDDDTASGGGSGSTENRLRWGLGTLYDIGKKISEWFHFSRMGMGHSESITNVTRTSVWRPRTEIVLPPMTRYEAAWWKREVKLDGGYNGHSFDRDKALECAEVYAKRVSIGDLKMLRRFLETSLNNTDRLDEYIRHFLEMLVPKGRDLLCADLSGMFGRNQWGHQQGLGRFAKTSPEDRESLINLMMGYTRKRKLLVPVWATD